MRAARIHVVVCTSWHTSTARILVEGRHTARAVSFGSHGWRRAAYMEVARSTRHYRVAVKPHSAPHRHSPHHFLLMIRIHRVLFLVALATLPSLALAQRQPGHPIGKVTTIGNLIHL